MACIILHNFCIDRNNLCESRWRLEVKQFGLIRGKVTWLENKEMSDLE